LKAGRGTEFDTSRASAQLSTTLATIDPLEASVQRSIHRLSVLTGRDPNALQGLLSPQAALPELPKTLAVGDRAPCFVAVPTSGWLSGSWLPRTPRSAWPSATISPRSASRAVSGLTLPPSRTGTTASKAYSIGPGISWAAFDLGRVHARVAGAKARNSTALAQYEKTVLGALEETENALVTHARARTSSSMPRMPLNRVRPPPNWPGYAYEGGIVDFLEVLDAERTQLVAEDQLAQTRTRPPPA